MKLKIMEYNISNGFHTLNEPYILEKNRVKLAQQIIKKENPDILCLTEACFAAPNPFNIRMEYQKIFGYKHAFFASRRRQWGNMILSRFPIDCAFSNTNSPFAGLSASLIINGKTLFVDVIHPSPQIRDKERIENIKRMLDKDKLDGNYILAGDFNSLSHEDAYDNQEIKEYLGKIVRKKETLAALLDKKFIKFLLKQGLIDVMKKYDDSFTIPTDYIDTIKDCPLRLDYFFVSKKIKVINARVIKNLSTEHASDHYPIVLEIEI
jgi:endonuclease/exonuclease/phosphatase family metal-dependent hydrolase